MSYGAKEMRRLAEAANRDVERIDVEEPIDEGSRVSMSTIKAGDKVTVIDSGHELECTFMGFTDRKEKYSEKPVHKTMKDVRAAGLGKNAKEIEALDGKPEYGHNVYAVFKDDSGVWTAYVYKGRWALGSGATSFSMLREGSEERVDESVDLNAMNEVVYAFENKIHAYASMLKRGGHPKKLASAAQKAHDAVNDFRQELFIHR